MKDLLPILLVLICPLMMLFMMRGMHGLGKHANDQHAGHDRPGVIGGRDDPDVTALLEERDELEARVEELEARMSYLDRARQEEPRVPTAV